MTDCRTIDQKIHELKNEWNKLTYTPEPDYDDSMWVKSDLRLIDRLSIIGDMINELNNIPYDPIYHPNHLVSQVPHKGY